MYLFDDWQPDLNPVFRLETTLWQAIAKTFLCVSEMKSKLFLENLFHQKISAVISREWCRG